MTARAIAAVVHREAGMAPCEHALCKSDIQQALSTQNPIRRRINKASQLV